jgi:hypothetical protein
MKTISKLLLLLAAVITLAGCIDADNATPQQGSKESNSATK